MADNKEGMVCTLCKGSGNNPSRTVTGRLSTGSSARNNDCPKCGGKGLLYPVEISLHPASMTTKGVMGEDNG